MPNLVGAPSVRYCLCINTPVCHLQYLSTASNYITAASNHASVFSKYGRTQSSFLAFYLTYYLIRKDRCPTVPLTGSLHSHRAKTHTKKLSRRLLLLVILLLLLLLVIAIADWYSLVAALVFSDAGSLGKYLHNCPANHFT